MARLRVLEAGMATCTWSSARSRARDGDAVVGLLPVEHAAVAERGQRVVGESGWSELGFLQPDPRPAANSPSHCCSCGRRTLSELTFQLAIFMAIANPIPGHGRRRIVPRPCRRSWGPHALELTRINPRGRRTADAGFAAAGVRRHDPRQQRPRRRFAWPVPRSTGSARGWCWSPTSPPNSPRRRNMARRSASTGTSQPDSRCCCCSCAAAGEVAAAKRPADAAGAELTRLLHALVTLALLLFTCSCSRCWGCCWWAEGDALAIPFTPWTLPPMLALGEGAGHRWRKRTS